MYLLERRLRLIPELLEVHVLVRVIPGLGVTSGQVSTRVRTSRSQIIPLSVRREGSLKAHVLVGVIVHAGLAVLRVAALENGPGPTARGRRGPREHHVLVEVLLLVAILSVAEAAVAMGRVRDAALRQGLQVVVEGVRWQRRRLARIETIVVKGLTGRRGERTRHVEIRGVVLLRGEHFCHAECLSLPDADVYFAELGSEHVLNISDAFRCTCKYILL